MWHYQCVFDTEERNYDPSPKKRIAIRKKPSNTGEVIRMMSHGEEFEVNAILVYNFFELTNGVVMTLY